jgi:mTERF
VISFLRSLGVRQEHLFSRILCGCPAILGRDVDTELTPLLDALAHLGVAPAAAARLACAHPELLMAEPDAHVARLARYLRGIGASDNQIAALLHEVPHALSGEPEELFGRRVAALAVLGIEGDALRAVVRGSALFLTAAGAPQEQIDLLCGPLGYSKEQASNTELHA